MIHKLKALIAAITVKEVPHLDPFKAIEKNLGKLKPKARPSFKNQLKGKLLAQHQDMMEEIIEKQSHFFSMHKFATVTASVLLLVAVGGGGLIVSADAPIPTTYTMAGLEEQTQPSMAPITIDFDQPMMRSSVEAAFSMSPAVEGNFLWEGNKRIHFLPNENLDPELNYTVTVSSEAKSLLQKPLPEPYERAFETFNVNFASGDLIDWQTFQEMRAKFQSLTPEQQERVRQRLQDLEIKITDLIESGELERPPNAGPPPEGPPPENAKTSILQSA